MPENIQEVIDRIGREWAEFKKAVDDKTKLVEQKAHVPADLEAKISKMADGLTALEGLKAKIEALEVKANRPLIGADGKPVNQAEVEHKAAWLNFIRRGREEGLRDHERKAFNITTDGDGGYLVPKVVDAAIADLEKVISPMRQYCTVVSIGTSDYHKLLNKKGMTSGWVGEATTRTETNSAAFADLTPYMGEVYANPAATQQMLDDGFVNVETLIAQGIAEEFAYQENYAFLLGNGTNQPKGIMSYTFAATADSSRTFGQLEKVKTGSSGAFKTTSATVSPADDLDTLISKFKPRYLQGAVWMMNAGTLATVMSWKDNQGHQLWQPSLNAGIPSTLRGYPVVRNDDMAAIGADALPILFGNFKEGYTIADRVGIRSLRDPYTNKPYVMFYTTKRVGGMVTNSEALKAIALSA